MTVRDIDQSAEYKAEAQVEAWLSEVSPVHGSITINGQPYAPEPEIRFGDISDVQRYVDAVLTRLQQDGYEYDGRVRLSITVRPRRGHRKATYERAHEVYGPTIAIPTREVGGEWALREITVLHEIAHHLQPLTPSEPAHGPTFRSTMLRLIENIGRPETATLLALAFEREGLSAIPAEVGHDALTRVSKLLKQAERTDNPHERDLFLSRAQQEAYGRSIALAVARQHSSRRERAEEPETRDVVLGPPRKRGLSSFAQLLVFVASANDIRCMITSDSTTVGMTGFPSDLDAAEAIFAAVLPQMVQDCEAYLGQLKANRAAAPPPNGRRRRVSTISARLAFYRAYANRVHWRLQEARTTALAAADDPDESAGDVTAALAIRDKQETVEAAYQRIVEDEQITGTWTAGRRAAKRAPKAPDATRAGDAAARQASLDGRKVLV